MSKHQLNIATAALEPGEEISKYFRVKYQHGGKNNSAIAGRVCEVSDFQYKN